MNWNDLIAIARVLASGALPPLTGRPRRAEISRAISTIYYAAFHALANNNANTLIGSGYQARNDPAWMLTYRTIDHRSARARCQHPAMSRFPIEIIEMADLFVRLQAARHRADYAPQAQDSRSEVLQMATETETELTIRAFEAADPTQRRSFAATCSSGKGATDGSRKRWHCPVNRAGGGAAVPLHRMAGPGRPYGLRRRPYSPTGSGDEPQPGRHAQPGTPGAAAARRHLLGRSLQGSRTGR